MKIGVLLKQVPDTETRIKIKPDGSGIDEGGIKWVINPYDEYAVEEALRLKEKKGGEVVIVTAGPARAVEAMRQALAMGADRGIRIDVSGAPLDSYSTAVVLSKACANEKFDIIFAGKQAIDDDCGQVHLGVAEMLSLPHVNPVEKFAISDDMTKATLSRPVAGGTKEVVESPLPVVIGCEKGLNEPRYASLPGIMKARSKPIAELKSADLLGGESLRVKAAAYALPPDRKAGKVIPGEPEAAAQELVRLLREEAKAI
ncbi:MAG: electron transfer flavoprotein subunit beta/FixA family protein [Pseudomonadota bacterium]